MAEDGPSKKRVNFFFCVLCLSQGMFNKLVNVKRGTGRWMFKTEENELAVSTFNFCDRFFYERMGAQSAE